MLPCALSEHVSVPCSQWRWKPAHPVVSCSHVLCWLPSHAGHFSHEVPISEPCLLVSVLLAFCPFSHNMGGHHQWCDLWIASHLIANLLKFFFLYKFCAIILSINPYLFVQAILLLYPSPRGQCSLQRKLCLKGATSWYVNYVGFTKSTTDPGIFAKRKV